MKMSQGLVSQGLICIKSGLPVSSPSICKMCRRSCRLAGSRGKRYSGGNSYKSVRKPLFQ